MFLPRRKTAVLNLYGAPWRREDHRERNVDHEDSFTSPRLEEENESLAGDPKGGIKERSNLVLARVTIRRRSRGPGQRLKMDGTKGLAPRGNGIVSTRKTRQ